MTVAAIGPGTARALRAHGIEADIVPERAVAEGLVEALDAHAAAASSGPPRRSMPPRLTSSAFSSPGRPRGAMS